MKLLLNAVVIAAVLGGWSLLSLAGAGGTLAIVGTEPWPAAPMVLPPGRRVLRLRLPSMLLVGLHPLRPLRLIYGYSGDVLAAALPGDGGVLLACSTVSAGPPWRATTKIYQLRPTSGKIILARRYHAWAMQPGNFTSSAQYPLKVGPDGILWCVGSGPKLAGPRVRAVDWQSGRVVVAATVPPGFGIFGIFPVRGAALLTANINHPKLYLIREDGRGSSVALHGKLKGVPCFMAASGRTLSGVTAGGGHFVVLKIAAKGAVRVLLERSLPGMRSRVLAYSRLGKGRGVILAYSGGPHARWKQDLYFVSIRTGAVQMHQRVTFPAQTIATYEGQIYLISASGSVAHVGPAGRISGETVPAMGFSNVQAP